MGAYAMTATQFNVNSNDHTARVKSVQLATKAAQLDTTNMSSAGWKEFIAGLKEATVTLSLIEDFDDNSLDEDLWTAFGTVVAVTVKPTASSISANNPEFQFNVLVNDVPLGGAVGDLGMKQVTWPVTGAITRDVTA